MLGLLREHVFRHIKVGVRGHIISTMILVLHLGVGSSWKDRPYLKPVSSTQVASHYR